MKRAFIFPILLAVLDGIIDIYMPDMKYGDSRLARQYSKVRNYVEVKFAAAKEMHHQVGDLQLDASGIAQRGLLVRHLVLLANIAGTDKVLAFLARGISTNTYLNLMDQYCPCYRADDYPLLARPITRAEYDQALQLAQQYGLQRLAQRHAGLF
jgi:putative pyruvate formate lyase activating enzyme